MHTSELFAEQQDSQCAPSLATATTVDEVCGRHLSAWRGVATVGDKRDWGHAGDLNSLARGAMCE